jgi:hypothetical protein
MSAATAAAAAAAAGVTAAAAHAAASTAATAATGVLGEARRRGASQSKAEKPRTEGLDQPTSCCCFHVHGLFTD